MVRRDAPVKSIADATRPAVRRSCSAAPPKARPGSDMPRVLRDTLGLNIKLVAGYPDNGAMFLAVGSRRGERPLTVDLSTMKSLRPEWLKPDGEMHALVQFARATRHPEFRRRADRARARRRRGRRAR